MLQNIPKFNVIELFAGCGGLTEGFERSGKYNLLSAIEWAEAPFNTLKHRLRNKWLLPNTNELILRFDIQRTDELFSGWNNDPEYGCHCGLNKIIGNNKIHIVIGGPPCQAYSVAGRIRDANGMRNDYRNYLFESYIKVLCRLKPSFFVFENVPGLLTAKPDNLYIKDVINASFNKAGYFIPEPLSTALVEMSDFSVPQYRKRLIILGLSQKLIKDKERAELLIKSFYQNFLNRKKSKIVTVYESIGNLPKLLPFKEAIKLNGKKLSHSLPSSNCTYSDHIPRFHSLRDIEIFKMLAKDLQDGTNKYTSATALKELYTTATGRTSNIHKYHVLDPNKPSCLIPAHLFKDGLRHIHPDPTQARSITVREAARLQGFPDDFEFCGSMTANYQMIGNAVPPIFSAKLADALAEFINNFFVLTANELILKN